MRQGPGGGRVHTNVHEGPSINRPWIGSGTYERNRRAHGGGDASHRAQDRSQDLYHREEERSRRIRDAERSQAEREQAVRDNKAQIEADRRSRADARAARERAQLDEIRDRAAEQERRRLEREDRAAERHDRIMRSLQPCRAFNDDGSPCRRKANPGEPTCYLHTRFHGIGQGGVKIDHGHYPVAP